MHQRELNLDDELKAKLKEKEDLDDISNELELADEDDLIPYVTSITTYHDWPHLSADYAGRRTNGWVATKIKC